MTVVPEMQKLREWLTDHEIEWQDNSTDAHDYAEFADSDAWICRTIFELKGQVISVINGFGTYGGFRNKEKNNRMCLEMMSAAVGIEPIGWMSCKEVILKLKECGLIEE